MKIQTDHVSNFGTWIPDVFIFTECELTEEDVKEIEKIIYNSL